MPDEPTVEADRPVVPLRRVRVLVIDQHEIVRLGMRVLFDACPWTTQCLVTGDPDIAVRIAAREQPQVVLVDHAIEQLGGLRLARRIKDAAPAAKIVLLSATGVVDRHSAATAGVNAVLSRAASLDEIIDTAARLLSGRARGTGDLQPRRTLSARESEVLEKIAAGLSNPEIAGALHLSRHTVKQHTSALYRKLGVRNRAEAASLARQQGLVA